MGRRLSLRDVAMERIEALEKLIQETPIYSPHLFGAGEGLPEWEAAYSRFEAWLRKTIRKASAYDLDIGGQLESIRSSHARYDAEEEFRVDSQKCLAILKDLAEDPENSGVFPRQP